MLSCPEPEPHRNQITRSGETDTRTFPQDKSLKHFGYNVQLPLATDIHKKIKSSFSVDSTDEILIAIGVRGGGRAFGETPFEFSSS